MMKTEHWNFCELWWKSWTLISINKTVGQWIRLSHWQVINKETSLLLNQHFEKSTLETNILWIWHFLKSTFEINIWNQHFVNFLNFDEKPELWWKTWTLMKNLNFGEKLELWWKTWTLMKNLNSDEKLELWWKTWTLMKTEHWNLNNGFFKMFFGAFLFGETLLHKMQPGTQCHWDALEQLKKINISRNW